MFIIQTLSSQLVGGALLLSKNSACWDQNIALYSCTRLMHTHDSCPKDVRILRFGSDLQWSQKGVSGYSFSPTKVHMFRESTVSNEKDKTAFYCTVSAFNCAARHTMMLRDQNTSNYSFSLSSSLSIEKWLIISLLFTSTACNPPLSGSKGACWDFTEGACDLSETNIIDHDRFVDSPEECQVTAMI